MRRDDWMIVDTVRNRNVRGPSAIDPRRIRTSRSALGALQGGKLVVRSMLEVRSRPFARVVSAPPISSQLASAKHSAPATGRSPTTSRTSSTCLSMTSTILVQSRRPTKPLDPGPEDASLDLLFRAAFA